MEEKKLQKEEYDLKEQAPGAGGGAGETGGQIGKPGAGGGAGETGGQIGKSGAGGGARETGGQIGKSGAGGSAGEAGGHAGKPEVSETWAEETIADLDDFIESQGIYIRQ